jgi:putative addiction module component (TIGR02574 family)
MSPSTRKLLEEALHLTEPERASLAGALIESLHEPVPDGVEATWEAVIERRVHELETGAAKTVPWSEVRARLFSGYE